MRLTRRGLFGLVPLAPLAAVVPVAAGTRADAAETDALAAEGLAILAATAPMLEAPGTPDVLKTKIHDVADKIVQDWLNRAISAGG